jgi:hypothetical protein
MNKKAVALIVLVPIIVGCWIWLYPTLRPDHIDPGPYQSLGEAAAGETAKLLHNSGRVVLVDADFGPYKILAPTTEAEIAGFKKVLRKTGLKVAGLEKVTLARPNLARNGIFMQPGQLSGVIARHADVDAIVLFVGLAGPDDVGAAPSEKGPKLVLVSNYEPYYKSLAQKRLIQLAIAPRVGADAEQAKADPSHAQGIERDFMVVTPERAAE